MKTRAKGVKISDVRMAGEDHAVISVSSRNGGYMPSPCAECPWRKRNAGSFPAEAFRISANTCYDMAVKTFACHMAGADNPKTCAGFLLSESARDSLAVRIGRAKGQYLDVTGDSKQLFRTYMKMAVANGVDEDDEVLKELMPERRKRGYSRHGIRI